MGEVAPAFVGPWPLCGDLLRRETDAFVLEQVDPALPTRCAPWTVADVRKHIAATFYRFNELLRRGRVDNFVQPFAPDELDAENQRAIDAWPTGRDPSRAVCEQVGRFLALAVDADAPMPHQRGVIPVGLQMRWGLADVVIHHDDIAGAQGREYEPEPDVVNAIVPAYEALGGAHAPRQDRWAWILERSGR